MDCIGRAPLCGVFISNRSDDIEKAKHELKKHGITDIYELSVHKGILSDGEQFQWLDFLYRCLCEADVVVLHRIPAYQQICEQERKEAKEARKRHDEEIREREEEKKLLQRRVTDLEQKLNESRASRESIVSEYASLKDTMKVEQERRQQSEIAMTEKEKRAKHAMEMYTQRELELEEKLKSKELHIGTMAANLQKTGEAAKREVEQLQTEKEDERAKAEKEKCSLAAEMTKKLESKQRRVDTLTELVGEKERNETTLRQQVEELKKGGKEDRERADKEKCSLAAEITKKLASKQQHVDTLTNIVREKQRNETTLRQQVEELKNEGQEDRAKFENERGSIESSWKKELDSKEKRMEQLERETWKLRTNIQLESETRSAEQMKGAETSQWMQSLIPWMNSGKLAPSGKSILQNYVVLLFKLPSQYL